MRRLSLSVAVLIFFLLTGCETDQREPIRVFAASSLLEPLERSVERYHREYPGGRRISVTFAGSQELAAQIIEGAPADLFISADVRQMDRVAEAGLLEAGYPETLFENELVLAVRRELWAPELLRKKGLRLLLADPLVPLGAYSMEYLREGVSHGKITEADRERLLRDTLSFEASARVVSVKLGMGAGDGAFLYRSDALSLDRQEFVTLELSGAPKAQYLASLLTGARGDGEPARFLDYLGEAKESRELFASYGMDRHVE